MFFDRDKATSPMSAVVARTARRASWRRVSLAARSTQTSTGNDAIFCDRVERRSSRVVRIGFRHECRARSKPFIVDDACNDSRTFDNPAIAIHGIAAWAGYPIEDDDGWALGTFCLVATDPYAWTGTNLHALATLAQAASSEIALRHARTVIATVRTAAAQNLDIDLTGTHLRTTVDVRGRARTGRATRARTSPARDPIRRAETPPRCRMSVGQGVPAAGASSPNTTMLER
jgi:GAF domain-containing protein